MKRKSLTRFSVVVILLLALNYFIASHFFFRIDLTEDKRYTIAPATKQLLNDLDQEVFIKVYLESANLPADFRRLRNSLEQTLEEFKAYAGSHIKYRFIDPLAIENQQERDSLILKLTGHGINPMNVFTRKQGQQEKSYIFPGALLSYNNKETTIPLLKGDQNASLANPKEILNQSIENLEYEIVSGIRRLRAQDRKSVGIVYGHGELGPNYLADAIQGLSQYYKVYPVDLPDSENLKGLDAIIVVKPDSIFSEADKYKIDQFIMRGGKALFFIDALDIRQDSIARAGGAVSFPYQLNLEDMFFRYGVRFNMDFIEDAGSSGVLGIIVGEMAGKPQMEFFPWRHFPLLNNFYPHPIVKNLDAIYGRYVSTLDTTQAGGKVRKIPLISTTPFVRSVPAPIIIKLEEATKKPDLQNTYNEGAKTVAYLLEGTFASLYRNRITAKDPRYVNFLQQSQPTKILVVADGDMLSNEVNSKGEPTLPLGFDKNTQITFANKKFLINAVDYMLDDNGLIMARSKEVLLRKLNENKLQEQDRIYWQVFNVVVPLIFLILVGIARYLWRKQTYGKKS